MDAVITRSIIGPTGVIAMARRPLDLPFLPPLGTILVSRGWSPKVTEIEFDLEENRVLLVVEDDRSLARSETFTALLIETLARYTLEGWTVRRVSGAGT